MGSANSSAFLQGADDIDSAAQMCPLQLKTVALYPVRWAISQEVAALPRNFNPPGVSLQNTHYCLRTLTPGWVYLFSERYGTLHEYRVNEQGVITEVLPGANSVLLPEVDAEGALPCIHHPAEGRVFLKFAQHRWTARLQELVRTDAGIRDEYMQVFELDQVPENGQGTNIAETENAETLIEDFRPEPGDFDWSFTEFAQGLTASDLQGQSKKSTEFSYCVALDDEIGITSELGQLHALHVNLIMNNAEENAYAYTTARMVDALIAREAGKKETEEERNEVTEELKERIRSADKDAFVEGYHKQVEEYDQARARIFDDWKRWVDSDQLARKLEFNDLYSADGFTAVEQELSDILDGYVGAERGKEDAETWMAAEDGEAGTVGNLLKAVLFLTSATHKVTEKLKDLPGYDYGSQKIVERMYDMPAHVPVGLATDTLLLEFAAPAAAMGAWARNRQTRPQWKKWIKQVSRRYGIDVHENGMTLDTATELLLRVNQESLAETSGHSVSELAMSPLAAGVGDARIRSYLRESLIDVFHLEPDLKDNPFGWVHTRLDPVVESIKQNRSKFVGAVTFFHAFNMVSLYAGLEKTQQDVALADRSVIDQWLPFADSVVGVLEGVVNSSALLARSEYVGGLASKLPAVAGIRVPVVLRSGTLLLGLLSGGAKLLARGAVKVIAIAGPMLTIGLEIKTIIQVSRTGHQAAVILAGTQIGLSAGLLILPLLAVTGVFSLGVGVVLGAALVVITIIIGAVQAYIARSRIEDFLSQSFWGDAPTLRYWDSQSRPPNQELLETSKTITNADEGAVLREYFGAELDAFYYMLFSPIVRITEHMPRRYAITRQGEPKVVSEFTGFAVYFPGYSEASCAISIRLFEVEKNLVFDDKCNELSDLFERRMDFRFSAHGAEYRFIHYNHNSFDQLEMLIEYVKDGRKITGDSGLRIVLDGNDVEELSVDERLTFEL